MKPQRMLSRAKPAKVMVEAEAKVIAAPQHKQCDERSKTDSLVAIVMVDEEIVHDAAHSPSHATRAKDQCPERFVDDIFRARENEDAGGKGDDFCYEGVQSEWADICCSAAGRVLLVVVRSDEGLVLWGGRLCCGLGGVVVLKETRRWEMVGIICP